jgi:NADPH2:quinone reductase
VFIAMLGGSRAELDINELMRRRLTITGSTLRPRPVAFKGAIARSLREKVWPLIESGRIRPVVYKTFALAEAGEAHRLMESSQHIGKIVLTLA